MLRVCIHVCVMLTSLHHVEHTLQCSEFNVRTRFLSYYLILMNISGVLDPKLQTPSIRIRKLMCSFSSCPV
jgi:hypothetical protein